MFCFLIICHDQFSTLLALSKAILAILRGSQSERKSWHATPSVQDATSSAQAHLQSLAESSATLHEVQPFEIHGIPPCHRTASIRGGFWAHTFPKIRPRPGRGAQGRGTAARRRPGRRRRWRRWRPPKPGMRWGWPVEGRGTGEKEEAIRRHARKPAMGERGLSLGTLVVTSRFGGRPWTTFDCFWLLSWPV